MNHRNMRFLACSVFSALAMAAGPALSSPLLANTYWDQAAKQAGVDPLLLYSVGLVESRTFSDASKQFVSPYPWAIRSPEGSEFPVSHEHAIERLSALTARYSNIDVGYLQINWRWNGHRVNHSPHALLDPVTNLSVGAAVLAEAINSTDDLELGIGRYHHWGDELRAREYGRKVLRVWRVLTELSK